MATGKVLPRQRHLDHGVMGKGSDRVQPVDEHLERHVLIIKGLQAAHAHLLENLADRGVTSEIGPQHQSINEKSDKLIQSWIAPSGDRKSHRYIRVRTETRK
ncbi:Uncharacterised protein [Mycobacteroides abscessus subsp. abscessus]|nr:Uncharacterised protein [Mycobacteroides abscessus subsp. abscessus]SLK53208.1 Uncharacterised protein [Mycobacteroides abscessus subsp. abscessus]